MKFDVAHFQKFLNSLRVATKEDGVITLGKQMLGTQKLLMREIVKGLEDGVHEFVCLKARQLGCCLDPDTRVLTADLRWIPIKNIAIGSELVAVEENPSNGRGAGRKMLTTTVTGSMTIVQKAYRIVLDDGRQLICSANHRWLTKKVGSEPFWRSLYEYKQGRRKGGFRIKVGTKIRWITHPWGDSTFEDGWFGGMLDGEGSLANSNRTGGHVCVSQLPGPVFDRLVNYCRREGYTYRLEDDATERKTKYGKRPVPKVAMSRIDELFKLLGKTRPTRFLSRRFWEGKELPGKCSGVGYATITHIEPLPEQELVDLQTNSGTYIAEGFVSHNSTISLAFDLYYPFRFPSIDAALIVHDEPARDMFRSTMQQYVRSLPEEWRQSANTSNRNQMVFANESKIQFKIAGLRKASAKSLGRSSALTVAHMTEVSSWGDPDQIASLKSCFARTNPRRFYLWESTAKGFNHWERLFREAKTAVTKRAIFIGWWANEKYRCPKDSELFKKYWGRAGKPTSDELERMALVKDYYDVDIDAEQLAWYRYMATEELTDPDRLAEEFPWDEDEAFVASGSDFFTAQSLTDAHKRMAKEAAPIQYRLYTGREFTDLRAELNTIDSPLKVWEEPLPKGKAYYVLGADPAHGSSPESNAYAIALYRCWGNRLDQVAEFHQVSLSTHQFAWIIMYLAGAYEPCLVNLEINGPGQSVLAELQRLKSVARLPRSGELQSGILRDVTRAMSQYMWRKIDSISGVPQAMHTQSNFQMKERMLNSMKDNLERGVMIPHSKGLLEEMKNLQRQQGATPAAGNEDIGDDRVMAHALALVAWHDQLMVKLISQGLIWTEEKREVIKPDQTVLSRQVVDYMAQIGVLRKEEIGKRTVSIGGHSVEEHRRSQRNLS